MADDTPTVEQTRDALIAAVRAERDAPTTTTVANFRRIVRDYGIDQALAEIRALQQPPDESR